METEQAGGLKEEPGRGSGESREKAGRMQEGTVARPPGRASGGTLTGVGGRSHCRRLSRFSVDPSDTLETMRAQGPAQPGMA